MSEQARRFDSVAKVPEPGDNVAIATETLEAGTLVERGGAILPIEHTVLEGHRFAIEAIEEGAELLSWSLPFGSALKAIPAGAYACNEKILLVLRQREAASAGRGEDAEPEGTHDQGGGRVKGGRRKGGLVLPDEPNFRDSDLVPYELDGSRFRPGQQVPMHEAPGTFMGFARGGGRGVGTRNHVVVLGVTSRTAPYAKLLEARLRALADSLPNLDGVMAVNHTEGGEDTTPNNLQLLLRALSGFVVHPNVGAVLVVDDGEGVVDKHVLRAYMEEHGYPLDAVRHEFMSLAGGFQRDLGRGEEIVRSWAPEVGAMPRTEQPLSELKLALQCGGSDAFSGVSANPLIGWVAKEGIRHGGASVLAETDELIGAESYVLANVRDVETAERFLGTVERFKERVGWHGHTAEGNPSGGNNYRGLYNISIKSIGAAAKRDPEVRLDSVIEYAERTSEPGFHFMDSPGNDLESVAGQVASGCNLIFFTTGNGSITNFPFVPTLKVVTTTGRYELLSNEMDVNAGAYLDGTAFEQLGMETFDRAVRAASGEKTVGEMAGHSQVQIWRDWKQTSTSDVQSILRRPEPDGVPLRVGGPGDALAEQHTFEALGSSDGGYAADRIALLMPTSLCSGQVALMIAERLNERGIGAGKVSRFVALPHTEGCGNSGGSSLDLYTRTMLGHLAHPLVRFGLLLEHGCEKTHNDYFRSRLSEGGLDPDSFGWASVQLDGGIESVTARVEEWFVQTLAGAEELDEASAGLDELRLGLLTAGELPDAVAHALAELTRTLVDARGTVVLPERSALLSSPVFLRTALGGQGVRTTLAHGQAPLVSGLHVMEAPSGDATETVTGLGATGVEVMLAHVSGRPLRSHRMIPMLQASAHPATVEAHGDDLDVALSDGDPAQWADELLAAVLEVASRQGSPRLHAQGDLGFQVTRGLLGVSM